MKKQLLLTLLLLSGCCANKPKMMCCEEIAKTYHPVVHFEHNSADLSMHAKHILNEIPAHISHCPNMQFEITGYTDNTGTADYNKTLGMLRAQNIENYLETLGINVKHIHTASMGEHDPASSNDTEESRKQNRRAIIQMKQ